MVRVQEKGRRFNTPGAFVVKGDSLARREGRGNLGCGQGAHVHRNGPRAKIAFGLQVVGRTVRDRRMVAKRDSIGDHRGRRIGHGSTFGQNRDAVGNPERPTATPPALRCNAPHRIAGLHRNPRCHRMQPCNRAGQALARFQMQGDVAAVIDIGAAHARLSK